MDEFPQLSRAPVAEAIVEIRARLPGAVDTAHYTAFAEHVKASYPQATPIQFVTTSINVDADGTTRETTRPATVGARLASEDGGWVVQARNNGLSISRLPPYRTWSELVDRIKSLWAIYCEIFKPQAVIRLGVRYINRIDLPAEVIDFDEMLTAGPKVPPSLPQVLERFVTQIVVPLDPDGTRATITQGLEQSLNSAKEPRLQVLLDIDAVREEPLSTNEGEILSKLEILRRAKNMAFFGSLTEKTLQQLR